MSKKEQFNVILAGVGGQGIITLTRILAEAALIEKKNIKTSELHGLSQRGGSVETHVRFGPEIYSPLVRQAGADLVVSLEAQESLKACHYGSKGKRTFLVNDFIKPIFGNKRSPTSQEIKKELKKFSKKVIFIKATEITKKELNNPVLAGVYLLSVSSFQKLIPLKPTSLIMAIGRIVPKKYLKINKKAFELAKKTKRL